MRLNGKALRLVAEARPDGRVAKVARVSGFQQGTLRIDTRYTRHSDGDQPPPVAIRMALATGERISWPEPEADGRLPYEEEWLVAAGGRYAIDIVDGAPRITWTPWRSGAPAVCPPLPGAEEAEP